MIFERMNFIIILTYISIPQVIYSFILPTTTGHHHHNNIHYDTPSCRATKFHHGLISNDIHNSNHTHVPQYTMNDDKENNDDETSSSSSSSSSSLTTTKAKTTTTTTTTGQSLSSYQSAIAVLQQFHSEHGHLAIPHSYIVPSTSTYPREFHNKKLASIVYNMKWWSHHVSKKPERVYELNQLEFVWERLQTNWNLVLEALVVYKSIYGHVRVPTSFVVPIPSKGSGAKEQKDDKEQIEQNGIDDSYLESNHVWPKSTWGIPLGNCVHRIRTRGDFLRGEDTVFSRRRQLDSLGFVWDVGESAFETFYHALKLYKNIEVGQDDTYRENGGGSTSTSSASTSKRRRILKVKSSFVVPSGEYISKKVNSSIQVMKNPWPKELWGYPLGAKCTAVRQKELYIKNQPARQKRLQDLGFQKHGNATLGWLEVMHAAAIYSRMHGRVLDVPINFVVPHPPKSSAAVYGPCLKDMVLDGEWPWPESLCGLPLGQRLKDVRLKGRYLNNPKYADARRQQLNALGFVWNPKRGRRKRSLGGQSMLEVI